MVSVIVLSSCDKKNPLTKSTTPEPTPVMPSVQECSKGQLYQTFNQKKSIRLIKSDELEFREGEKILLCKYNKQDGSLRVVVNRSGADEVLYFTISNNGLTGNGIEFEPSSSGIPEVYNRGYFAVCTVQANPNNGTDALTFVRSFLPKNDTSIRTQAIKNTEIVQIGVFAEDGKTAANRANEIVELMVCKSNEAQASNSPKSSQLEGEIVKQKANVEALRKEAARLLLENKIQDASPDSMTDQQGVMPISNMQENAYYAAKKTYIQEKNILEAAQMRLATAKLESTSPQQAIIIWARADVGTR